MVEPNMSLAESLGAIRCWGAVYEQECFPNFQWVVQVARPDFIRNEPNLLSTVLATSRYAAKYSVEHVDEFVDFTTRIFDIPRAVTERAVARQIEHLHVDGEVDLAGLDEMIKLQRQLGAIDRPMTAGDITDLRFSS
jgi:ABC-type nitrate/sulfonate/bicarbonate transport system substrate-binding protein